MKVKTKEEKEKILKDKLVIKQIRYHERIRKQLNLNIVTCGDCGATIVHRRKDSDITCPNCLVETDTCDCPDIYYKGMLDGEKVLDGF